MFKKFLKYSVPSAIAMCVSSLYTVIDGIFVGQGVGKSGLAAVSIAFPAIIFLTGLATMFAAGGGALVSKNFGAGNRKKAVDIFNQAVKTVIILSLIISILFVIFAKPMVTMLGASKSIKAEATEFLRYYSLFCIPNLLGIALNGFVRNDGSPRLAMIATISGAILNVILDYIFIFSFHMGLKGPAIATGLGQIATVIIILPHFLRKKGQLTFGNAKLKIDVIKNIFSIGFPSFFAEVAFSIIIFFYNIVLNKTIGETGVASYSIINYVTTNIYMMLIGVSFGAQPLISYYFGNKDSKVMLQMYKFSLMVSTFIGVIFTVVCFVFGMSFVSLFTSDVKLINMTYLGLNITNLAYIFIGLNLNTSIYYQAIEMPRFSSLICSFRSFIFLPLVLFLLAYFCGINGIWASMIFSEILSFVVINIVTNIKSNTKKAVAFIN
ncbi:MATE family efflux transporter [Clostridium felsineum]|uniref:Multidrug export protein MepA n=1 Tax=Clostridium felsineum TaxID=36839 RepID=A0A1S8LR13_9CLOT|nr:MATE family efflux transporter [Clostridium felsineum]MCR3761526.1 MATE family efflux transporter [Clostridium felsineum]URZ01591.1 Multidrug export protein MepA [Clostridium felsineum]URZ05571.1 Multidrug export protein MepA [Clostridium felsineum]URZ10610.1 Multidrug export protein MepA [Clostridium felsineum]